MISDKEETQLITVEKRTKLWPKITAKVERRRKSYFELVKAGLTRDTQSYWGNRKGHQERYFLSIS